MNDQTAPTLSRRQRFNRQHENQEQPKKEPRPKSHGGLVVLLVLLSLVLLASAPVYGLMKNSPKTVKTTSSASSQSSDATSSAQSSTSQSATSSSQADSAAQSSQSQANQASDDQAAASAATANTATLNANQTLYNFAVTHGTTTDQIYALNPGVTAQNYSRFAGQALKIK
ncbi:LysM peptidoglycan-binding domain-containing protein [Fructobacillus americanaquae]|uniref:LysM peptidoglycan-binding domain-containing protein n=1 Tax=Fructobacillus americanaquae TaxID=2940302 RepID=A0ABY5C0W1_9LACO|nr:LysM domain-containing protein [Fructobacillus americanaquae]USS92232.1 LysM peptidoglycan-binding domain-containing protein [Fructobacillus americanaquae]